MTDRPHLLLSIDFIHRSWKFINLLNPIFLQMEFAKLFGFLGILKKSIMIMSRNGRLMATVTSIYLIIASLLFVFNISSIIPMISDFVTKLAMLPSLDPTSLLFPQVLGRIQQDVRNFLGVELAFLLAIFLISLIGQTAIILLAGVSYKDKIILPKDLLVRVPKSVTRLFITSFHVALARVGFLYFGFIATMVPTIIVSEHNIVSKVILWVLMILVVSLYLHFSVVWVLSLVVSVLEECYGNEALGKAGRLVKGKKLEGFCLNLVFNIVSYVLLHELSSRMMVVKESQLTQAFIRFILMSCICLIAMFEFQAYTVLYFECKKNHGEEIELQGNVEYSKIPSITTIGDDLP